MNNSIETGLLFSFDGASRGNPGPAALGVCGFWGYWMEDEFVEQGCFVRKGRQLGIGTNNYAESHSLAFAIKMALHWHFWLADALVSSRASQ